MRVVQPEEHMPARDYCGFRGALQAHNSTLPRGRGIYEGVGVPSTRRIERAVNHAEKVALLWWDEKPHGRVGYLP